MTQSIDQSPPSLRDRRRLETRDEIVQAGIKVFKKHGFQGATVDEIARVARVSRGTYYLHFANKTALAVEIGTGGIDDQIAAFEKLAQQPGADLTAVREWLELFVAVWRRHRTSFSLGLKASVASSEFVAKDLEIWHWFLDALEPLWGHLRGPAREAARARLIALFVQLIFCLFEILERKADIDNHLMLDALAVMWHRELTQLNT